MVLQFGTKIARPGYDNLQLGRTFMIKLLAPVVMLLATASVQAGPIFNNTSVVTTVTNIASFDGISGSLLDYTEDGIVVSVDDTQCCFADVHYGDGGNFSWVTISLAGGGLINSLDFLLGDGFDEEGGDAFNNLHQTNLLWETFVDSLSTGFGDVFVDRGSTVGWTDTDGFTSIWVAAPFSDIPSFGDFQTIALDNVRIGGARSVPEPATLGLLGLGLFSLGFARRKMTK
jgi:hypothetical protein